MIISWLMPGQKSGPVILAGVISEVRKEDVLVYYGHDCRKESQTTPYPQLGPAGVGYAVSLKCSACLVITTRILCWRDVRPRQCDWNAQAGIFLAMKETALPKQQGKYGSYQQNSFHSCAPFTEKNSLASPSKRPDVVVGTGCVCEQCALLEGVLAWGRELGTRSSSSSLLTQTI